MNNINKILISEATLKYSTGCTFREKLDTVRLIGRLGADAVETGSIPEDDKSAALLVRTAGALLENCIISVEVTDKASADTAAAALASAAHPRLAVSLPLSTVQAEYLYHKKPAVMLSVIKETVEYAVSLCPDVEFRAGDATRAEADIFEKAIKTAVGAGAGTVTLCDTAGEILPDEFAELVVRAVEYAGGACVGVECSDRLGLSAAAALAAVRAGASKVSCSFCAGAVPLESFAEAIAVRGNDMGLSVGIDMTMLGHTAKRIKSHFEAGRSEGTPFENGVSEASGQTLQPDADLQTVSSACRRIGYELSEEDIIRIYEQFKRVAEKSGRSISDRELDAIIASAAMPVPPVYTLEAYVINSGNTISSTAHITLLRDSGKLTGFCVGDGPIDAAFLAIEQIIGHHYELDDFQIQSVTEGREAMGEAIVRLRSEGRLYSGKGLSTDIIGASIRAYISALNKIAYEERNA